ncbi:hypothetical protein D3C85_1940420 [compost metagenome]
MQEPVDRLLLVEPLACGKRQRVDTTELAVGCVMDEPLESIDNVRLCRLAQRCE